VDPFKTFSSPAHWEDVSRRQTFVGGRPNSCLLLDGVMLKVLHTGGSLPPSLVKSEELIPSAAISNPTISFSLPLRIFSSSTLAPPPRSYRLPLLGASCLQRSIVQFPAVLATIFRQRSCVRTSGRLYDSSSSWTATAVPRVQELATTRRGMARPVAQPPGRAGTEWTRVGWTAWTVRTGTKPTRMAPRPTGGVWERSCTSSYAAALPFLRRT
jgi:hypothetical protein